MPPWACSPTTRRSPRPWCWSALAADRRLRGYDFSAEPTRSAAQARDRRLNGAAGGGVSVTEPAFEQLDRPPARVRARSDGGHGARCGVREFGVGKLGAQRLEGCRIAGARE